METGHENTKRRGEAMAERRKGHEDVRRVITRAISQTENFLAPGGPAHRQNLSDGQVAEMTAELNGLRNLLSVVEREIINRPDEAFG